MKKLTTIFYVMFLGAIVPMVVRGADEFSFDEFAIVEGDAGDVIADGVEMNYGAAPVSVNAFDIAGVMLGMSFEDVQELFFHTNGLYTPRQKNSIVYTIHPDWKYNLDYECRQNGVVVPAELEKCINTAARNRGLLYASELHLERPNTGETLVVHFTSNVTDNKVWRVEYNNDVNEVEGDAEKFENQRQKKILVFWQSVLDKYGSPNSGSDKWISSTNAYDPMMIAYYGALELSDRGLHASDAAQNVIKSRENFQPKPYAF